jgi:hypothetical protein
MKVLLTITALSGLVGYAAALPAAEQKRTVGGVSTLSYHFENSVANRTPV